MFNKNLSKTLIPVEAFVDMLDMLDDLSNNENFITHIDYYYLKNYFIPKIFKPRNIKAAENFINNPAIFKYSAHMDLLKECDLTDFIIEHRNSLDKYPFLYECTAGFKISDEAAWILMENSQYDSKGLTLNFYSVWMRPFEKEDTHSEKFKQRLERALKAKKDSIYDSFDKEEVFYGHDEVNKINNMMEDILNFHLGIAPQPTNYSPFFINNHFKHTYATLDEKVLFWVLGRTKPKIIPRCPLVIPILLYSKNVPDNLQDHVDKAKRHFDKVVTREKYAHIWRETLNEEEFKQLSFEHPNLIDGLSEGLLEEWETTPDVLIKKVIESYRNCNQEDLNKNRVRVFTRYLKQHLEDKYDVLVPCSSLSQLLSIYDSTV